ncbi:MAG: hypothetical protein LBP53_04440 [Candidatus Peribacteria bacterium]|jgi:hypothetical protein|nr:hypothetical protein [Candidatus Peribacteria bacterium]
METGILSTNSIAKQTTEHSLVLNSTQANVPLFNLGRWEELKDPNAEFKDLMEDKGDKTIGFQKQIIELNIEKNRTLSYLITTFGIDKQSAYLQNQSPGIYHLFQVVENSLRTPEECRIFREQMQRLNVLIGNKDTSTTNTTETTTENQSPPTSSEKPIEQTEKQVDLPSELQEYFSPTKRQQDIKNL